MHINVLNQKTENNRPLKQSEIVLNLPELKSKLSLINADKIIALGKTAHTALTLLDVAHLEMPHPSGMNRQLNDKEFTAQKIKELEEYVNGSDI